MLGPIVSLGGPKPRASRWISGVKFSLLAFFVKALVAVLRDHPIFNASIDEDAQEIVLKKFYNIGIAVDTPEGLIVPVIKNADRKGESPGTRAGRSLILFG